jgi:hypothetical protein
MSRSAITLASTAIALAASTGPLRIVAFAARTPILPRPSATISRRPRITRHEPVAEALFGPIQVQVG